jgi:hypothetical protein
VIRGCPGSFARGYIPCSRRRYRLKPPAVGTDGDVRRVSVVVWGVCVVSIDGFPLWLVCLGYLYSKGSGLISVSVVEPTYSAFHNQPCSVNSYLLLFLIRMGLHVRQLYLLEGGVIHLHMALPTVPL